MMRMGRMAGMAGFFTLSFSEAKMPDMVAITTQKKPVALSVSWVEHPVVALTTGPG